jgi:propanediol dehydratase large subunit
MMALSFVHHGELLTPGHNVDPVDIAAGVALGARFGFDDAESQMVLTYALQRWARGEEAGAEKTIVSHGIDYTTWRAVLAEAVAAGTSRGRGSNGPS